MYKKNKEISQKNKEKFRKNKEKFEFFKDFLPINSMKM